MCAGRQPVQRNGERTPWSRGLLARPLAWLYCTICVRGLAVQKQPQYLRSPQQRRLVQLRLPVRPGLLLRWRRQQDGTSKADPHSKCLITDKGNLDWSHPGRALDLSSKRGKKCRLKFLKTKTPEGSGAPGGVRTPDPVLRRHVLYPSELRAHNRIVSSTRFALLVERLLAAFECGFQFAHRLCTLLQTHFDVELHRSAYVRVAQDCLGYFRVSAQVPQVRC